MVVIRVLFIKHPSAYLLLEIYRIMLFMLSLFAQNYILMALQTLAGFMADITATEIPPGFLSMTIFPTVRHPVSPMMRNRLLTAMTINAVTGIMTVGAQAPVMGCFHSMAAVLPAKGVVAGFLRPMAGLTEFLPIRMTVDTG